MPWRYTVQYLVAGFLAVGIGVVLSNPLSWLIAIMVGAAAAWHVSLRGGGLPLLVGLIGVFGPAFATTLTPGMAEHETVSLTRFLAYTLLAGSLAGGAVGSFKREIDRQRASRGGGQKAS